MPGRMVLGRSTGSQTPHSNLPDLNLGISPSMQSTPEDRFVWEGWVFVVAGPECLPDTELKRQLQGSS